eukprot:gene41985-52043_t
MKKPFYKVLYVQVLFAILCGVLMGIYLPTDAVAMKPLGDGFIKLIKMIIAPVIFCTVVSGIAGMQDVKKIGRVGGKALLYFEVVSTFALVIGLFVANLLRPGDGFNVDPATLDTKAIAQYTEKAKHQSTTDFVMNIIPNTVIDAFAKGDILQVLLISVLFGFALSLMGEKGRPLAKLMGSFYLTCFLFVFIVLGSIAKFTGFSITRFINYVKEELLIVLGTSSSESALPSLMRKLEKLGCAKPVVGLVVPTGYSFNLDGTNIYMTMAALFVAQATNTDLTLVQDLVANGHAAPECFPRALA